MIQFILAVAGSLLLIAAVGTNLRLAPVRVRANRKV
jgi:hypothetical protein